VSTGWAQASDRVRRRGRGMLYRDAQDEDFMELKGVLS
jgi:hypothetical protein